MLCSLNAHKFKVDICVHVYVCVCSMVSSTILLYFLWYSLSSSIDEPALTYPPFLVVYVCAFTYTWKYFQIFDYALRRASVKSAHMLSYAYIYICSYTYTDRCSYLFRCLWRQNYSNTKLLVHCKKKLLFYGKMYVP